MRILVTIAHYFKSAPVTEWDQALGSGRDPVSRIAALNSEIVALHRYFGPHRTARDPELRSQDTAERNTLDIVLMTVRDANLLDRIGIDPSTYSIEYFEGPPIMLAFEAQRIMRDRCDSYDLYVYLEDDLTIVDPAFFAKIKWFSDTFGPDVMLLPTRYEMSHSGVPAKVEFSPRLSSSETSRIPSANAPEVLSAEWLGISQTFRRPNNPHSACFVVSSEQLKRWTKLPTFYDRDPSFVDPLVSASTFAPLQAFSIYRPAEPDPWFLSIEHFGVRYSSAAAGPGEVYGESPILALAEAGQGNVLHGETINSMLGRAAQAEHDLQRLRSSRSELVKALAKSIWKKR
jgi:hypothetical protein